MARSIAQVASGSNRNRGVLLLAALFGLLSAALMFAFLSSRGGTESASPDSFLPSGEVESVVVFARDVDFGVAITPDMLTEQTMPLAAILPDAVRDREELIGKVTTTRMFAGEQVLPAKVTTGAEQNTLSFKVPEGMRALSLQVPHEAWVNAGLPQPGDRVDVLGITTLLTIDPLTGVERPDIISGLIAEDVQVLAVSQTLIQVLPGLDDEDGNGLAVGQTPNYVPVDGDRTFETAISVTLALTPADAAKVAIIDAMKDDEGQYRILTRYQADRELVQGTTNWTLDDVFRRD
jgi:pilus assembly protein CpaB